MRFGFSPCPNDTFAFWAAAHGRLPASFVLEPVLADIEALNERAVTRREPLPVTKLSLPALAAVVDDYAILPSGAALGFGCGPLVVCREAARWHGLDDLAGARVAIPGRHTTAFLLLSVLAPVPPREVVPMRFEQVMPAVARGDCDAGLVIHESRFTYRDHGLRELADLGVSWERATGGPLPLGVIAARRDLDAATFRELGTVLRASVELARREPERPRAFVQQHAQELAADVQRRHIDLYVNDFSVDLGAQGRSAIEALLARGRAAGLLPAGRSPFREDA
ncbi:MAG: 1,4-dihydroxy-6-naphthoate synthase [Planctomycetes bacterium]|nr:1,4-dihydroxy-6-naphthoate synthase [Planctomycetota bacterium]